MARRPTRAQLRRQFEALAAEFEVSLAELFLGAVSEIRSDITLRIVAERLERGDLQGAVEALNIDRQAFGRLSWH